MTRQLHVQYWMGEGRARALTIVGPYDIDVALKRAVEIKAQGGSQIVLKDQATGDTYDVEQFMKDNPPGGGNA